jgi:fused signal recognition particle receptor
VREFFQRLKRGLHNTHRQLSDGLRRAVGLSPVFDEAMYDHMTAALIAADCGVDLSEKLIAQLRDDARQQGISTTDGLLQALKGHVVRLLSDAHAPAGPDDDRIQPRVTVFVGVNGAGKTTSIGKIGCHWAQKGRRVLFAAADTFRAAAAEQLSIWAERANAQLVNSASGADPAAVAFDAVSAAYARAIDDVLIDTAGRLQSKSNLMAELTKVRRSIDKARGERPGLVRAWLVLDATTGQNGLSQAERFREAVGLDGIVLTKLDGTARGGIVLAIADRLKLPVVWVGVGESLEDLETFDPVEFADALFD